MAPLAYPDLATIQSTLREANYPEHLIDDWAQWLHENFHAERLELRTRIFQTLVGLLMRRRYGTIGDTTC